MLFILSLRGLSTQETARRGNRFGIIGMSSPCVVTAIALLLPGDVGDRQPRRRTATVVGVLAGGAGHRAVSSARCSRRASR